MARYRWSRQRGHCSGPVLRWRKSNRMTAGNTRLEKRGSNNTARDDVAAALTLGVGALARKPVKSKGVYLGMA